MGTVPSIRLSSGEFEVLDEQSLEHLSVPGERRAIVDERNRPVLNEGRAAALRGLERFVWWHVSEHFPEKPDENAQFRAAVDWWFGFGITSSMLLAPVIAAMLAMYYSDAEVGLQPSVATAVALISLMLLLLVMQRLTHALWGQKGSPGLLIRRALVLLLPASVMASIWWLAYPMESVRVLGFTFPLVYVVLLVALLVEFVYLYLSYSSQTESREFLKNATPADAVSAYYGLLRPVSNGPRRRQLAAAVQYLEPFQRSTYLVRAGDGEEGAWVWPLSDRPQSMTALENEIDRASHTLFHGVRLLDLKLRGEAYLRASGAAAGTQVVACCAIESVSREATVADSSVARSHHVEELTGRPYVAHRLLRRDDGWYFERSEPQALPPEDVKVLRSTGLLP